MAIMVWFDIRGATAQQYDSIVAELDRRDMREVPQRSFHAAGPAEDGWRVCDVWDSQEAFDRFASEHLMQIAQQVQLPPFEPQVVPVHNVIASTSAPA